jgi:hypothetical protein
MGSKPREHYATGQACFTGSSKTNVKNRNDNRLMIGPL